MQNTTEQPPQFEPEELLSSAKYLVELIQQDLNIPRKETVPPRLARAIECLVELQTFFPAPEKPVVKISKETADSYYGEKGYAPAPPAAPGLYVMASEETGWYVNTVAVTKNDYQMVIVHHENFGERSVESWAGAWWKRLA